jgi:hypothetical protein
MGFGFSYIISFFLDLRTHVSDFYGIKVGRSDTNERIIRGLMSLMKYT